MGQRTAQRHWTVLETRTTTGCRSACAIIANRSGLDAGRMVRRRVETMTTAQSDPAAIRNAPKDMIWIPGGTFQMGSERHYPEEAPVHPVTVDGFWIDRCQVTNAQFRRFAKETGYVTVAEREPNPAD